MTAFHKPPDFNPFEMHYDEYIAKYNKQWEAYFKRQDACKHRNVTNVSVDIGVLQDYVDVPNTFQIQQCNDCGKILL